MFLSTESVFFCTHLVTSTANNESVVFETTCAYTITCACVYIATEQEISGEYIICG